MTKIGTLTRLAMSKLLDLTRYVLPQDQQCWTTKQELFDLISEYVKAVLTDSYNLFVISETTPAVTDNDKTWIQVDSNGAIIDVKTYASGSWKGRNTRMIGEVVVWPSETPPEPATHWHKCDGSELAIASYGDLYSVIGTTFNTGGEAAGNFRIPDTLGRCIISSGEGDGLTLRAIGDKIGEEDHTLTSAEMPAHTHNLYVWMVSNDSPDTCGSVSAIGAYCGATATTTSTGSGDAHNNIQPSIALPMFIRILA